MLKTFLLYKTVLFISCGSRLKDPTFDALLRWAREQQKAISHRHRLLTRDDDSIKYQPLIVRKMQVTWSAELGLANSFILHFGC
jgi:hypothetical protein